MEFLAALQRADATLDGPVVLFDDALQVLAPPELNWRCAASDDSAHGHWVQPFGLGGRRSADAYGCRPDVAAAGDWSTLKLDACRRRRAVALRFENAHGIAIGAAQTPQAERLRPNAANLPIRPSTRGDAVPLATTCAPRPVGKGSRRTQPRLQAVVVAQKTKGLAAILFRY